MHFHSRPHSARTILFSRFGRNGIDPHSLLFGKAALGMSRPLHIASLALCLLSAGVVVTSPAALASQSRCKTVMTSQDGLRHQLVEFGDLRLDTAAGNQTLQTRIRRAARRVCVDSDPRLPLRQTADRRCERAAAANAMAAIGSEPRNVVRQGQPRALICSS
jgi:UrcA family protein